MAVARAFGIVILSGAGFALVGSLIGFIIGTVTPDYYREVFPGAKRLTFVPATVGLGLGASQGLVGGLLFGLVLVPAVAWLNSWRLRGAEGKVALPDRDRPPAGLVSYVGRWALWFALAGLGLMEAFTLLQIAVVFLMIPRQPVPLAAESVGKSLPWWGLRALLGTCGGGLVGAVVGGLVGFLGPAPDE